MEGLENLISMLNYALNTKRIRHITGGILISVSLLFGGLALAVITVGNGENDD
jgi:hypothetical protein